MAKFVSLALPYMFIDILIFWLSSYILLNTFLVMRTRMHYNVFYAVTKILDWYSHQKEHYIWECKLVTISMFLYFFTRADLGGWEPNRPETKWDYGLLVNINEARGTGEPQYTTGIVLCKEASMYRPSTPAMQTINYLLKIFQSVMQKYSARSVSIKSSLNIGDWRV